MTDERERTGDDRLALVLSGGGSKGALQVGLYRALCELGVRPDLVVGASVGALNGAFIAAGVGPRSLARGWAGLERGELFGFNWSLLWQGASAPSLFSGDRFRGFLEGRLPVRRFEELELPFYAVSTHLSMGTACTWHEGDLVEAVLASCSVPGLLPPVRAHGDVLHVDGSLGDNLPVEIARAKGATRIVAMTCRTCAHCPPGRVGIAEVLGRAFSVAADCTLRRMVGACESDDDVLLLQPDLGEHVYALDFSQGERLMQAGYEFARPRLEAWLGESGKRRSRASRAGG